MSALVAVASRGDVGLLFLVLAILAFVVALYLVFTGRALEAVVSAIIGVIILIFGYS